MELRVIRDELQYVALLEQAKELALADPMPGSQEAELLAVISVLLEKFEESRFRFEAPDPIEAVIYRLAELGMKQKDFAKIIGSASRASEVFSRKRGLTIEMIRAIHEQLRIPADILIGYPKQDDSVNADLDWKKFPVKEMQRRGWFDMDLAEGKTGEELVRSFFSRTAFKNAPVLLRKTISGITKDESRYAIYAWIARVLIRARDIKKPDVRYIHGCITDEFLRQIAKLSRSVDGPKIAVEFLAMKGVVLVVEPHLPKTKLDGAAMLDQDGTPVIGLTLRYGRVDYFWFTLMHELIHVQRHLNRQNSAFVDEEALDGEDEREAEANFLAAEAFIPRHIWQASEALKTKRGESVVKLAESLMIHPSIVAGRIQRETNNYRILKEFGAEADIREIFNILPAGDAQ
jgi:HTH-type transcriptional regulator/antitoxin HigA